MLIGLSGYKGSGKTVAATILDREHGFRRINFKDGLIKDVKKKFPELLEAILDTYNQAYGPDLTIDSLFTKKPPLMRALLQNYGTDVMRGIYEDCWVDIFKKEYKDFLNIVADDVRFANEARTIKSLGGTLVRIIRSDITNTDRHPSETEHENFEFDYTIVADKGDHATIRREIESIIK